MESILKHGLTTDLKAWSCVKKLGTAFVFSMWLVSILACSLNSYYVSALDLTATAGYKALTPVAPQETVTSDVVIPQLTSSIQRDTPIAPEETELIVLEPTLTEEPPLPTATRNLTPRPPIIYYTQAGDTLPVIAARYGVNVEEIKVQTTISPTGLISPGTLLIIPDYYGANIASDPILPDSEVIYSPSALDFNMRRIC